jgi:hypothetical protein
MTFSERYAELQEIEWAGFSRKQEMRVIGRILADEPPELWMRGLDGTEAGRHDGKTMPSGDRESPIGREIGWMFEAISNPPRFEPEGYNPQPRRPAPDKNKGFSR